MALMRIATRGSAQARRQTEAVAAALEAAHPGLRTELVLIETTGDRRLDVPIHTIGGQGVFVKEVQRAVLDGEADIAVHSAKDLPSRPTDGLLIAAFTERRDPRDALVGAPLASLPEGATVATGSVRRRAQLAIVRPDLTFAELRGNIPSRLGKVPPGGSIMVAVAALQILGLTDQIAEAFEPDVMVPAPGQGCVAVECRVGDAATADALEAIDHLPTREAVAAERAFLAELGSGCSLPVGAHASGPAMRAFLADPHTGRHVSTTVALPPAEGALHAAAEAARACRAHVSGDGSTPEV